eukprot:6445693-Alexandrium_andersonii.AAC.1
MCIRDRGLPYSEGSAPSSSAGPSVGTALTSDGAPRTETAAGAFPPAPAAEGPVGSSTGGPLTP